MAEKCAKRGKNHLMCAIISCKSNITRIITINKVNMENYFQLVLLKKHHALQSCTIPVIQIFCLNQVTICSSTQ